MASLAAFKAGMLSMPSRSLSASLSLASGGGVNSACMPMNRTARFGVVVVVVDDYSAAGPEVGNDEDVGTVQGRDVGLRCA